MILHPYVITAMQFLAITTDDSFHTPDEDPRYVAVQDIIDAANAKNIKVGRTVHRARS